MEPDRGKHFKYGGTKAVLANPWEQALDVVAVGADVEGVEVGERVMITPYQGLVQPGGLVFVKAEYVTCKVDVDGPRVTCDATGNW